MIKTTVIWHKAEEVPIKSDNYFCVTVRGGVTTLHFSTVHNRFNTYDDGTTEYEMDVVLWAEIPEQIKKISDDQFYKYY